MVNFTLLLSPSLDIETAYRIEYTQSIILFSLIVYNAKDGFKVSLKGNAMKAFLIKLHNIGNAFILCIQQCHRNHSMKASTLNISLEEEMMGQGQCVLFD